MASRLRHHVWVIGAIVYSAFMWGIWYSYVTGPKVGFSDFDIVAAAGAFSVVFVQIFGLPKDKEDY